MLHSEFPSRTAFMCHAATALCLSELSEMAECLVTQAQAQQAGANYTGVRRRQKRRGQQSLVHFKELRSIQMFALVASEDFF